MIAGAHTILYSRQADAVRAFFKDVLGFPSVDAGHGWLIFAMPPAELALHPAEDRAWQQLYLMCSDIRVEIARLEAKGVEFTKPVTEQRWGLVTEFRLPDGETLGLYEPRHPTAIRMGAVRKSGDGKTAARKKRPAPPKAGKRKKRRS
jgi:catechol 2,3-dioxygenase-like lactoylglutathione lyase family enzyme